MFVLQFTANTSLLVSLGADNDYTAGQYEITFMAGDTFDLMGCVDIPTIDDMVLEGDHDFIVSVYDITPDGAVTASGDFTVTITDAADGW